MNSAYKPSLTQSNARQPLPYRNQSEQLSSSNAEDKETKSEKMNQGHEFSFDVGERIESTDENGKIIERASTLVINESGKKETSKNVSVLGEKEILTKSRP